MVVYEDFIYQEMWVARFLEELPLWRKILARFFDKYKVSQEEYREWFYNKFIH